MYRAIVDSLVVCLLAMTFLPGLASAQPSLSRAIPGAISPAGTTRVVLTGDKFSAPVRVQCSAPLQISIVDVQPQKLTVDLTPKAELPLGPVGLWLATAEGVTAPLAILVDTLPSIAELTDNHSLQTAQTLGLAMALDGTSDGKLSDFFRFHADASQEITFEILAQPLHSALDPVARLISESGQILRTLDDDAAGPDCRFRHQFSQAGNYYLEIYDNRYAAGGRYRLRLGDLPLVAFPYPMVIQRGAVTEISFGGLDGQRMAKQALQIPMETMAKRWPLTAKVANSGAAGWTSIELSRRLQMNETEPNDEVATANPIDAAQGINGMLLRAGDRDFFKIRATKDQSIRLLSSARSLGSACAPKLNLRNSKGESLAKSVPGDSDEPSLQVKFPADGDYYLEVEDLLRRGGPEYGYHISIGPEQAFNLTLKPDVKTTRDSLLIQAARGAAPLDIVVQRDGYTGPIQLKLEPPTPGLKILNATIPADAKEAKVFLISQPGWQADSMTAVRLVGMADPKTEASVALSSAGLLRVRQPQLLYPASWSDGLVLATALADKPVAFDLFHSAEPVSIVKKTAETTFRLQLKRLQAEFKEAISLVHSELPAGWTIAAKAEKEEMNLTLKHAALPETASNLRLWWYAEFGGRGQIVESAIPLRLVSPGAE